MHHAATPRGLPVPDSLPRDQMTTLAWFLSRSTVRSIRSEIGVARQAGSSLNRSPRRPRRCSRVSLVPRGQPAGTARRPQRDHRVQSLPLPPPRIHGSRDRTPAPPRVRGSSARSSSPRVRWVMAGADRSDVEPLHPCQVFARHASRPGARDAEPHDSSSRGTRAVDRSRSSWLVTDDLEWVAGEKPKPETDRYSAGGQRRSRRGSRGDSADHGVNALEEGGIRDDRCLTSRPLRPTPSSGTSALHRVRAGTRPCTSSPDPPGHRAMRCATTSSMPPSGECALRGDIPEDPREPPLGS
jgi:hypothetical protein